MTLLTGKTALISGSGRGIGAAAARLFAQSGAAVVVTDLDLAPAEETAHLIAAAGGQAIAVKADVTKTTDIDALISATASAYGGIDILVNNAGYTWDGMFHKLTDPQWEAMLAVHLTAPFHLIRAALPYMRERAKTEKATAGAALSRKIINVSSTTGTRGNVGQTNYAAGKAGIIGLTKTLAKEWGPFNIQVNAVAFGWIDTRLTQVEDTANLTERDGTAIKLGMPEAARQAALAMVPMGRPGTPDGCDCIHALTMSRAAAGSSRPPQRTQTLPSSGAK